MKSMNLGVIFSEGTKRAMRYDLVFVCSTCDVHVLIGTCRLVGAKSTPSMNSNIHPDLSGPASQVLITVYASYTVHWAGIECSWVKLLVILEPLAKPSS